MRWLLPLLSLLLAGCATPDATPTTITTLGTVTDPRDTAYLANGTPGSHVHDYWQGRAKVPVLDFTREINYACSGCNGNAAIVAARPEEGIIVPQGTRWVNLTFDAASTPAGFELWVQTARDGDPVRAGPIVPGSTFSFESSQPQNDPPHYVLSLWSFEVRIPASDFDYQGKVRLAAEAVRGLPLLPYPPHPDRWGGASELTVLEQSQAVDLSLVYETPSGYSMRCYGGCPTRHELPNGTVVPFESGKAVVTLGYDRGIPTGLMLSFHGSDTRKWTRLAPTASAPGLDTYEIAIQPGMADSPYAPRSLWAFDVEMQDATPVRAWSGTYTLKAVAVHA